MPDKIFLGGTCNGTAWRDDLISSLNSINFFNPVVDDWTPECQQREDDEKENKCNIHFYCITSSMTGVFSIAEVADSVHNKSKITVLHVIPEGFDERQLKSLEAVINLVKKRGGIAYMDQELARSARVLNNCFSSSMQEKQKRKE